MPSLRDPGFVASGVNGLVVSGVRVLALGPGCFCLDNSHASQGSNVSRLQLFTGPFTQAAHFSVPCLVQLLGRCWRPEPGAPKLRHHFGFRV